MLASVLLFQNYSQKLVTYYSQNYPSIIGNRNILIEQLVLLTEQSSV